MVTLSEILQWAEDNNKTPGEAGAHFQSLGLMEPTPRREPAELPQYTLKFTELASAFAKAKWSLAAVEERIRGELAELALDGCKLSNLIFHSVFMDVQNSDSSHFIISPIEDSSPLVMEVDLATYEETEVKVNGMKVMMPSPDSE